MNIIKKYIKRINRQKKTTSNGDKRKNDVLPTGRNTDYKRRVGTSFF